VWDTISGEVRRAIDVPSQDNPEEVFLSDGGGRVAVRLADGELRFWEVASKETAPPFPVPDPKPPWDGSYPEVFPSPDGRLRLELGRFGPVSLVDADTDEVLTLLGGGEDEIPDSPEFMRFPYTAAFSPDGSLVAVKFTRHVQVWDTATYETVGVYLFPAYRSTAEHLKFIGDGSRLAFTVEDKVIIETVP
jgi:WD40 repeat protein